LIIRLLSLLESADLTRHSRQLLADAYLESGVSDTHNLESELDFPVPIFAPDDLHEEIDHDEDDDFTDLDDKKTEEIIYRCVVL